MTVRSAINLLPAVVEVEIFVAEVFQTKIDHLLSSLDDEVLRDLAGKLVPRIPAHLRDHADAVVESGGARD